MRWDVIPSRSVSKANACLWQSENTMYEEALIFSAFLLDGPNMTLINFEKLLLS